MKPIVDVDRLQEDLALFGVHFREPIEYVLEFLQPRLVACTPYLCQTPGELDLPGTG